MGKVSLREDFYEFKTSRGRTTWKIFPLFSFSLVRRGTTGHTRERAGERASAEGEVSHTNRERAQEWKPGLRAVSPDVVFN